MAQHYTSKDTSINNGKLPYVFSHLEDYIGKAERPGHYILDIGCGKKTDHIRKKCNELGWGYIPYDPYNQTETEQSISRLAMVIFPISIATMSNVANVIDDDEALFEAIRMGTQRAFSHTVLVTIYEGDGTGIGKQTGPDQYQRNMKRKDYLPLFKSAGFHCLRIPKGYAVSDIPFKTNK